MSDPFDFPVSGRVDPELLAGLRALVEALKDTKDRAKDAGESGEGLATRFNALVTASRTVLAAIPAVAEQFTALADEQARLDESSARLGLDFDEAAAAAGRFADETEAMQAANTFAQAGIRLTQQELNALERVAGSASRQLGVSTKDATEQLTQALVSGAARGLRGFGGELAAVAEGGSTAAERLQALVTQAEHTEQATDSAADAQERFKDAIEDSQRVFASAFVTGLARLSQVGTTADTASERLSAMQADTRAAGEATAEVVMRVGQVTGVVVGFLGTGIGTIIAGLTAVGTGMTAIVDRDFAHLGDRARAAFERSMTQGIANDSFQFMRARLAGAGALSAANEGRTSMAAPAAESDMTFTAEEQRAAEEDSRARRRRSGGGGGGSQRRQRHTRQQALGAEVRAVTGVSEDDARHLGLEDDGKSKDEARTNATRAQEQRDRAKATEREKSDQDKRAENLRSFNAIWRDMHHEQVNVAANAASLLDAGLKGLGQSVATHGKAILSGAEDAGRGVRAILSETAGAFADEAWAKAGFYAAESIAALVRWDVPGAGTAAAASVAYLAAGATFSALGAAAAPPPMPAGGASRAAPGSGAQPVGPRGGAGGAGGGQVINVNFGGPVIGGTEAQIGRMLGRMLNTANTQTGFQLAPGVAANR